MFHTRIYSNYTTCTALAYEKVNIVLVLNKKLSFNAPPAMLHAHVPSDEWMHAGHPLYTHPKLPMSINYNTLEKLCQYFIRNSITHNAHLQN